MAFTFSLNNAHTPQQALYELKEKLKLAGWSVLGSGDGTAGNFSTVADILTTWSAATDGITGAVTNRRAWWRIQSPDGARELLWQHAAFNTASDYINIAYSRAAGFVGTADGAVAANIAPTSTDAFLFAGERRPSLNMTGNSFSGGTAVSRVDYIIGDASEDYSFACLLRTVAGVICGGIIYDRLANPTDAGDPDATVVAMVGNYSNFFSSTCTDHRGFWTWGDAGVGSSPQITQSNGGPQKHPANAPRTDAGQRCALTSLCYWGQNVVLTPGGSNPYTGDIDLIEPVYWYSAALAQSFAPLFTGAQQGTLHGESRIIKARSTNAGFNNMDTNVALTRAAQTAGFWVLWDGATTPVL